MVALWSASIVRFMWFWLVGQFGMSPFPSPVHPANTSPLLTTVSYNAIIVTDAKLLHVFLVNLSSSFRWFRVVVDAAGCIHWAIPLSFLLRWWITIDVVALLGMFPIIVWFNRATVATLRFPLVLWPSPTLDASHLPRSQSPKRSSPPSLCSISSHSPTLVAFTLQFATTSF